MNGRSRLRDLLPPAAVRVVRRLEDVLARATPYQPRRICFVGNFASWEDAERASRGYDDRVILDRTVAAARKVKAGEAAFERDSVTFAEPEFRYPLLWSLYRLALRNQRLRLIDFGGALASTYFQHRRVLPAVSDLHWAVVEQHGHVAVGAAEFATTELSFHGSIDNALTLGTFDGVLLSGVLQCLPQPYDFLEHLAGRGFDTLIFDRVPFMCDGRTRLTVQHVPPAIYPASYPAWFFSEQLFFARLLDRYDLIASWPALDQIEPAGGRAFYRGYLLERK